MSPINRESILEKLKKLDEMVVELQKIRKDFSTEESLYKNIRDSAATERFLIIGIESVVDIGNHLLHELFRSAGSNYREVVRLLGEKGIVPKDFAVAQEGITGFRNILVHEYTDIDPHEVFSCLQKAPEIFGQFAKYYINFLQLQKSEQG